MSETASGAFLTGREARFPIGTYWRRWTDCVGDEDGRLWPRMTHGLSDWLDEETYACDAHLDAHEVGIQTCLDEGFDGACGACAVEAGLAVMITWDTKALEPHLRAFAKVRAHAHAWWAHKRAHEESGARETAKYACTPANLRYWDDEAGLGVCSDVRREFGKDYRIKALIRRVRELEDLRGALEARAKIARHRFDNHYTDDPSTYLAIEEILREPEHLPVMHGQRITCRCGDFNCASLDLLPTGVI